MTNSRARLKIIAIGFNTHGTGLTRVMQSIMRRLAERHEIHYLGIGYSGEIIRDRGLTIYPTNPKGGDVFAAFQAKADDDRGDQSRDCVHPAPILLDVFPHYLKDSGTLSGPAQNRRLHPARRQDRQ